MGLSILIVIIASLVLGLILGAVLTRPRRWDLHVCVDDAAREPAHGTAGTPGTRGAKAPRTPA
ncbi:hypothetical protein ACIBCT_36240 [Streptosporangium sp. NPDC050855]|uniref:hypothetical protein n=1 Tax=Streptosporangium sp. NPDC050855 TaxID=3366194 RepID=UPI0037A53225